MFPEVAFKYSSMYVFTKLLKTFYKKVEVLKEDFVKANMDKDTKDSALICSIQIVHWISLYYCYLYM